jgi:hypothetical protein
MNYSDSTDAHIAAAPWADPYEAMMAFSDTTLLQEDLMVSAPGYLSSAGSELPNFNDVSDAAFTPTPTTSMGAFTNLTSQINHMYLVSKPRFDRRHDLPCHGYRMSQMLGPCRGHVRLILGSPTILRVHQMLKFS